MPIHGGAWTSLLIYARSEEQEEGRERHHTSKWYTKWYARSGMHASGMPASSMPASGMPEVVCMQVVCMQLVCQQAVFQQVVKQQAVCQHLICQHHMLCRTRCLQLQRIVKHHAGLSITLCGEFRGEFRSLLNKKAGTCFSKSSN